MGLTRGTKRFYDDSCQRFASLLHDEVINYDNKHRYKLFNPSEGRGNYSATWNDMKLVH